MLQKNATRQTAKAAKTRRKVLKKGSGRTMRSPYRPGSSPEQDAWFTAFFIENHLDHYRLPGTGRIPRAGPLHGVYRR